MIPLLPWKNKTEKAQYIILLQVRIMEHQKEFSYTMKAEKLRFVKINKAICPR